jgi:hypothetical protein
MVILKYRTIILTTLFTLSITDSILIENCLIYSMISVKCLVCSPGYKLENFRCDSKLIFDCPSNSSSLPPESTISPVNPNSSSSTASVSATSEPPKPNPGTTSTSPVNPLPTTSSTGSVSVTSEPPKPNPGTTSTSPVNPLPTTSNDNPGTLSQQTPNSSVKSQNVESPILVPETKTTDEVWFQVVITIVGGIFVGVAVFLLTAWIKKCACFKKSLNMGAAIPVRTIPTAPSQV